MDKKSVTSLKLGSPCEVKRNMGLKPHDIWQHYKGKQYRIIALSCDSEDLTWYVVYETLYNNPVSQIWHRPLAMFLGTVEIDGVTVPRFKKK